MSDDDKLRRDATRGARMHAILEDDLVKDAFIKLELEYTNAWKNRTGPDDIEGRERIWHHVQALSNLRSHLMSVVSNGRLAQAEIDRLK